MDNYLQNLRMRQMFPVPPITDYSAPPSPQPIAPIDNTGVNAQQPFDVASRMAEMYTPETQASDRYNELVQNQPQYENPSFLRTMGAALSAFGPGGHKTGQEVMNWHNDKNMTEWKNDLGPAQQAADNERQTNNSERVLAHSTVSNELRARADNDRTRLSDDRNDISRKRNELADYKAKNPNVKFDFSGPKVKIANPGNGQITVTDIDTGKLSEMDKLSLQQENAMERIDAQGNNTIEAIGARGNESRKTQSERPVRTGSVTGKSESPAATRTRQYNKAQQISNTRADLAPFIKMDTGGRFIIKPPGKAGYFGSDGPTPEQAAELNSLIYGDSYSNDTAAPKAGNTPPAADSRGNMPRVTPPTSAAQVSPAPPGKVRVMGPDGKPGFIPASQLAAAVKQGYKQVQ